LRLQAFGDDRSSIPIDVIADSGTPGALIEPPHVACALLEPPLSLDLPDTVVSQQTSAAVIVHNDCLPNLGVDEAVLQTDPTWEVLSTIPADVPLGGQETITVMHNPPAPGALRNYLRIRLADGVMPAELRLVTVNVLVR
jgi:hypothetical protein